MQQHLKILIHHEWCDARLGNAQPDWIFLGRGCFSNGSYFKGKD